MRFNLFHYSDESVFARYDGEGSSDDLIDRLLYFVLCDKIRRCKSELRPIVTNFFDF